MNGQIRVASNKRETILTNVDGFRTKLNNKLSEKLFLEESAKSLELKREKAETSIKVVQAKIDSYTLDLTSEFETQISAQKQKELNDLEITLQKVQKNLNTTTEALQGITTKIDSLNRRTQFKVIASEERASS